MIGPCKLTETFIPPVAVFELEKAKPTEQRPAPQERWWLLFSGFLLLVVVIAASRWIIDHPYAIHWDEALYFDNVLRDLHNLYSRNLRQLGSILIGGDIRRPPANLLIALPFLVVFGFHTAVARFVTLASWLASAGLIFVTSRRIGTVSAAALAVLVFCLSPEVIAASIFFSTEGPLFLATAMMFYFLCEYWKGEAEHRRNWIGLGFALGLGVLSKSSFVLVASPALAATLFYSRRHRNAVAALRSFYKAGGVAFVIAAPWWLKNLLPALTYSFFAREQPRNSLGNPSLVTWAKWFFTVVVSLIGPGTSILIGLASILVIRQLLTKRGVLIGKAQEAALVSCMCAVVPLLALQLSGTNHQLRYLCPAVIPFSVVVAVLADLTGWIHSRAGVAGAALAFGAQVGMLVAPVIFPNHRPVDLGFFNGALPWRVMARFEQWDWTPLRNMAQSCGLEKPKIAFLGMGRPLNPPQLEYAWFVARESPSEKDGFAEPIWLWRYEQGPIRWEQVISSAEQNDIVLVAPTFVGEATDHEDLDNQYNGEFAERLSRDAHFGQALRLEMGRFGPVDVLAFRNRTLVCASTEVKQLSRSVVSSENYDPAR